MSDDRLAILHLYLAVLGGMVIAGAGLVSFLWFDRLPVLSFVIGPLVSAVALMSLHDFKAKARRG